MFCDSQSAICLSKIQVDHARTKHIDVRFYFVQEIVNERDNRLLKMGTTNNPVDMFTAVIARERFWHCLDLINVGQKK